MAQLFPLLYFSLLLEQALFISSTLLAFCAFLEDSYVIVILEELSIHRFAMMVSLYRLCQL
jgi:hypothetical protein